MIYFIRHGEDDENYIGGWSDVDLTEAGVKQVLDKKEILKNFNIKKIISSDIKRARTTSDIISYFLNIPIIYSEKFRELNKGDLTGLPIKVAEKKYFKYTQNLDIYERYPNGESLMDLYNRISNLISELEKLDDGTLIVTHRGVINMIYFIMNNQILNNDKKQFDVTHASIHQLDVNNKSIKKVDERNWQRLLVK